MKSGGDEERALRDVVEWIQRLTVNELGLGVNPADVGSDAKFIGQRIMAPEEPLELDSIDLAGVIVELDKTIEQALRDDLQVSHSDMDLIEAVREEFQDKDLTIEKLARFLIDHFPLEPERVRGLALLAE